MKRSGGGSAATHTGDWRRAPLCYAREPMMKRFSDLRIAVLSLNKLVPDVATYARALVLGNPLVDQIRARGSVDPERVIEALAEAIPREFGTDPTRIPLQAIVFEVERQ